MARAASPVPRPAQVSRHHASTAVQGAVSADNVGEPEVLPPPPPAARRTRAKFPGAVAFHVAASSTALLLLIVQQVQQLLSVSSVTSLTFTFYAG